MLTWPHPQSDWQTILERVEPCFVEIARQIALHEKLLITCYDAAHQQHVTRLLTAAGVAPAQVLYRTLPSNDSWARDHGPLTVLQDTRPMLLDFTFNGWGGKYPAALDNALTRQLHQSQAFGTTSLTTIDLVLEGGAIEVDGAGTLLTTRRCLLAPTRNPALDQVQIEQRLAGLLGITRVLWLDHGHLAGDDTDSHIDTLARFCSPDTIAYVQCDHPADEHYRELHAMEQELMALRTAEGKPYTLVPLPWPQPKCNAEGQRLPATYANFLIINDAVLLPTYEDPADAVAIARLQTCFPQRTIVPIPCLPLIHQYGSLHCVTMQLPCGVL